jgi:hypothetical protein
MSILDKFLKSILAFDPSDIPEVEDDNTDEIDETEEEVDDMKEVRELKKNITLAFKDVINYTQDLKNKKIESIDFIDVIIRKLDNIKDTINKLGVATESSENVKNILNDIDQVITFIKSGAINTNVEILNQLEAPLLELFEVWLYISQNTKDATNINFESYADDILNNLMKSDVNAADIIDQIKNYINDLKSKSNIDFTSVDLSLLENNAKKLVNNFKQKCAFAPETLLLQKASSVAAIGELIYLNGKAVSADEHVPVYLRKSQAEREREAENEQ